MDLGNYAGALEALNAGITCMVDWSPSETPAHADGAVSGLKRSGIRAMYANGMPGGGPWWYQSVLAHPDDARRIRSEHFSSDDSLLTMALALRQPGNVVDEVAIKDWRLAQDLDIRVSVHVGMRSEGGAALHPPVETLARLNLLSSRTTAIHCTTSSDHELQLLADSGTTISLAPYVEAIMGHGQPPLAKLMSRGVTPSLSVDTVTTSPGDMFTQMRAAYAAARAQQLPLEAAEEYAPTITHRTSSRWPPSKAPAHAASKTRWAASLRVKTPTSSWCARIRSRPGVARILRRSSSPTPSAQTSTPCWCEERFAKRHGALVDVDLPQLSNAVMAAHERLMTS